MIVNDLRQWQHDARVGVRVRKLAGDAADEIERLMTALETRQRSLDQIARMRVMHGDDDVNRVTLHSAIEVAKLHAVNG